MREMLHLTISSPWPTQLVTKHLQLKVMINDIFVLLYFGETFIDKVVTTLVFCTAFPSDHLSEFWFDAPGLTVAPKHPNKNVLAERLVTVQTARNANVCI